LSTVCSYHSMTTSLSHARHSITPPSFFFFFPTPPTTEIYTLSLHDALPIYLRGERARRKGSADPGVRSGEDLVLNLVRTPGSARSEEHTSELQSLAYLVCRLLLEKKKKKKTRYTYNSAVTRRCFLVLVRREV